MKTILLPTDFSDGSWKAADYVASLYRGTPCRYIIAHSFYAPVGMLEVDISMYIAAISNEVDDQISDFLKSFKEFDHHEDSSFETVSKFGDVSSMVNDLVKNNDVDLIVMGTRGASNDMNTILGSVVQEVLNHLPCPLICVPENAETTPPKHIMLTTNYQITENLNKLLVVREIAETHESRISIVHVRKKIEGPLPVESEVEEEILHNFFGAIPQAYFDRYNDDVEMGILNFANQRGIDLIVMLHEHKGFWKRLFQKSITSELRLHSNLPILALDR